MLRETKNLNLLVQYYEHLVNKVEEQPKEGAEFVYGL